MALRPGPKNYEVLVAAPAVRKKASPQKKSHLRRRPVTDMRNFPFSIRYQMALFATAEKLPF